MHCRTALESVSTQMEDQGGKVIQEVAVEVEVEAVQEGKMSKDGEAEGMQGGKVSKKAKLEVEVEGVHEVEGVQEVADPPDVRVTCGPLTLRLHSVKLAANSRFFAAMLEAPMVERESGKVAVKYVDPEVFKKVIGFAYTKQLSFDMEMQLEGLLEAADRFDMEQLKAKICEVVRQNKVPWVTGFGCMEACEHRCSLVTTAILAEQYNAEELFDESVKQMVRHKVIPEREELENSSKLEVAVMKEYTLEHQEAVAVMKKRRQAIESKKQQQSYPWSSLDCLDAHSYGLYAGGRCMLGKHRMLEDRKKEEEELDKLKEVVAEAAVMMEEMVFLGFEAWRSSIPDF